MKNTHRRGWTWAYRKLRGLYCSPITAGYRATRYWVLGDTGPCTSADGWQRIRLRREQTRHDY